MTIHPETNMSLPKEKLLRIGDIARQAGMTLRTLRYYEELGLIEPDNRTKGNFRLYHPSVIRRLEFIGSLKKLDFSLDEIRALLGTATSLTEDRAIVERTRNALLVKKDKITEKLIELEEMKQEVEMTLKILQDCLMCKDEHDNLPCDPNCEQKKYHIE